MSETHTSSHVVIVGAGHAGGSAASALRLAGHTGAITLIGDEPSAPYQRPPLSKAWLKGEADAESLLLKPEAWYAENDVDLRLSTRVQNIDLARRVVCIAPNGAEIGFDALILATGARARKAAVDSVDPIGHSAPHAVASVRSCGLEAQGLSKNKQVRHP